VSPKHTDEYFAERTRQAASLKPYRFCLKDPGGLLTPERMQTLVPVIFENAGGIPVELHTHCTTGLGPIVLPRSHEARHPLDQHGATAAGRRFVEPISLQRRKNARALGYVTAIDEEVLKPYPPFTTIAKREASPLARRWSTTTRNTNIKFPAACSLICVTSWRKVGLEHKFPEALEKPFACARVRLPIMVTPLSQFVGSQAAINVIVGERYEEVTDQAIKFALWPMPGRKERATWTRT